MSKVSSNYLFLFCYILFIVYGSLFPLVDWRPPSQSLLEIWRQTAGNHISRSDLITNILVYIPIGYLLSAVSTARFGNFNRILLTVFIGSSLSLSMEYLQMSLPARTSSPVDLLLNILSTLIGALSFSWLGVESTIGEWFSKWRQLRFNDGRIADIGLFVFVFWGAMQLAPFVPSLDFGDLKNSLKPLWLTLHDLSRFSGYRAVSYALGIASLGAVLMLILILRANAPVWLGIYCGIALLGKITVVGRQLSLEALVGLAVGMFLTIGFKGLPRGGLVLGGICSVAVSFIVDELRPDMFMVDFHDFNWIPFRSQMTENVSGIGSIIEGLWPFSTIGFFAVAQASPRCKIPAFTLGLFLAVAVLALEYAQTFIVGRYPDITTVILAVAGWSIPFIVLRGSKSW